MAVRSALINVMVKAAEKAAKSLKRDFGEIGFAGKHQSVEAASSRFLEDTRAVALRLAEFRDPSCCSHLWQ